MGGIFLHVRGGLFFAAAASLAYAAFYASERAGMIPPMAYGLTERLSDVALKLRLILYVPLFFIVGAIGGAIGRSLREGDQALNEARTQLNRALFDTETILENLSSGLATIDAGGQVRHWNRRGEQISDSRRGAVRGRTTWMCFARASRRSRRGFGTLEQGVEGTRYEVMVRKADGRAVALGMSTSLLLGSSGESAA
jgi:PAS domain S-box-containing protein